MMKKMETEKKVILRLEKLIEKEVDREKKRILDEQNELLLRFDSKCEICSVDLKKETRPIKITFETSEGLVCQSCYQILHSCSLDSSVLKKVSKYIDSKNGEY